MKELDTVVLQKDFPEQGLRRGDVGAIVCLHGAGAAFDVEFVSGDGETVALLTLGPQDVRPFAEKELLHVRELAAVR